MRSWPSGGGEISSALRPVVGGRRRSPGRNGAAGELAGRERAALIRRYQSGRGLRRSWPAARRAAARPDGLSLPSLRRGRSSRTSRHRVRARRDQADEHDAQLRVTSSCSIAAALSSQACRPVTRIATAMPVATTACRAMPVIATQASGDQLHWIATCWLPASCPGNQHQVRSKALRSSRPGCQRRQHLIAALAI